MMKKILLIILLFGCMSAGAQPAPHPYAAKINRILQRLPAADQQQLDSCMMQITALGTGGLTEMALMLRAPGKGNNTKLQYALHGYAAYISAAAREDIRKNAIKAWGKALKLTLQADNKTFLIRELALFGDNTAVSVLQPYLLTERYCDATVRALTRIGGSATLIAMEAALNKAKGKCELGLVKALGDLRYLGAEGAIAMRTKSADTVLKRTALFALANIASEGSEPVLEAAAEKSAFGYDATGATAAYLQFVTNLGHNWPTAPALAAANKILRRCKADSLVHVRIAALKIIADIMEDGALPTLMMAVDSKDPAYSAAALALAARNLNATNAESWVQKGERSEGKTKAAIITMLAGSKQRAAISLLTKALKDQDPQVRMAAINAAGQLQSIEMISPLLTAMRSADTTEVKAIGNTLLSLRSRGVPDQIAVALQHTPPFAQITLLQILVQKRANDKERFIRMLLNSQDPAVVEAARAALEAIVR
jgi:HEAT repeat protein